jgi:hypothetical protein
MNSQKIDFRAALGMLAACLVLSALPVTSAAQTYVFNTAEFATGHNPQAIANGDFNGDGIPDLVIANYNDSTVSVLLGTAIRTYAPGVTYATGPNPAAIAVADFNNDGKLDLAVVNNNCPTLPCAGLGSVSILLGNGDGTFQAQTTTTVGNAPTALSVSALNPTLTILDMVVTNSVDNTVSVLIGNGSGGFTVQATVKTGNKPMGVVTADFNLDGNPDMIVVNNADSTISYYHGSGKGTFFAPLSPAPATGPNPVGICVGDFNSAVHNKQNVPSIAMANAGSSTVSVMINRAPTTNGFDPPTNFPVAGPVTQLVCTVLNNDPNDSTLDGNLDIVALSPTTNQFSVLLGNGATNFEPHADYATGTNPSALTTTAAGLPTFTGSLSPGIAVVNGTDDTVEVFPGAINGAFQMPQSSPTSYFIPVGNQPAALGAADFTGDGNMDIAAADRGDNAVLILLGNGNGTFTQGSTATTGSSPVWVATGDVNNDGFQDMVTANSAANTLSVLLGKGDGTFQAQSTVSTGKKPVCVAVADFDNDGILDLAVVNMNDPSVEIFRGNGDGTFSAVKSYATGTGSTPNQIAVGDFNNDGILDLAVAGGANNNVEVFLGTGKNLVFKIAVNYAAGTNPTGVAAADFNGDGFKDLAVANNGSSTVSILLGNGDGTFKGHVDYPAATTPYLAFAEDFNGDSKPDVVVSAASTTSDRISVMLGNGDGTLQTHVDHASLFKGTAASQALVVADFNNDGAWDIATADQLANNVTAYLNTAVPGFTPGSPLNLGGVNLGSSSQQTVTVNNPGSAPLEDISVSTSGSTNYSQTNTCGASVLIGGSCSATVTFAPLLQVGTITGTLNFNDNSVAGQQVLNLTGAGNGATATLNTNSLTFPVTLIGTSSSSQIVTLTNNGNESLTSIVISTQPPFFQTNNCDGTLAPGATCNINVSFKPKSEGTVTGTLTITDNALNSPQTVSLSGTGTGVQLAPMFLTFPQTQVGSSSASQNVTVTNKGKQVITFTGITITGTDPADFTQTNNCTTLVSGASCTITVTFTPLVTGNLSADVSISDNGGGSPQLVPLSGTGI